MSKNIKFLIIFGIGLVFCSYGNASMSSGDYKIFFEVENCGASYPAVSSSADYKISSYIGTQSEITMSDNQIRCRYGFFKTFAVDFGMPLAVSSISVIARDDGDLDINWGDTTDNESAIIYYKLYRSTDSSGFPQLPIAYIDGSSYTDTGGLVYGVTYYYKVHPVDCGYNEQAIGNQVASGLSKSLSTSVKDITAVSLTKGDIKLSWVNVPGMKFYRVYRSFIIGEKGNKVSDDDNMIGKTFYNDAISNGISDGTRCFYTVQAVDDSSNEQEKGNKQVSALCDATSPKFPVVSSSTHKQGVATLKSDINFLWLEGNDPFVGTDGGTGIKGYYFIFNNNSNTNFNSLWGFTTDLKKNYSSIEDGNWYFHILCSDNAGNLSSINTYYIIIKTKGTIFGKLTKASGVPWKNCEIELIKYNKIMATTITGINGNYRFENVEFGRYTLRAKPAGFAPVIIDSVSLDISNSEMNLTKSFNAVSIILRSEVASYPNPARGNNITFVYFTPASCRVVIDVYNANAEKITNLEDFKSYSDYHKTSWDISGVAQGIYIYRIKLISQDNTILKLPCKKLAILRNR